MQGPGRVLVVAAGNSNRYPTYIEKPIGVSTHQPSALDIRPFGDSQVALRFTSAPKQPFTVRIFALNGQLMGEQTLQPSDATSYHVALPHASRGVVLVQVNSPERGVTGSNIIRF